MILEIGKRCNLDIADVDMQDYRDLVKEVIQRAERESDEHDEQNEQIEEQTEEQDGQAEENEQVEKKQTEGETEKAEIAIEETDGETEKTDKLTVRTGVYELSDVSPDEKYIYNERSWTYRRIKTIWIGGHKIEKNGRIVFGDILTNLVLVLLNDKLITVQQLLNISGEPKVYMLDDDRRNRLRKQYIIDKYGIVMESNYSANSVMSAISKILRMIDLEDSYVRVSFMA